MIFKLCHNQQIHRCAKSPSTLENLMEAVKQTFKDGLPSKFVLTYKNQDDNTVLLNTEDDFKAMVANTDDSKSVKIHVVESVDEGVYEAAPLSSTSEVSKGQMGESFQILVNDAQPESGIIEVPAISYNEAPQDPKVQVEELKPLEAVIEKYLEEPHAPVEEPQKPVEELQKPFEEPKEILEHKVVSESEPFKILEDSREESKEEKVEAPVEVKEEEFIDLNNKANLRAFIIQTIEESMPQIMANYLNNQKEGGNANMKEKIRKSKDNGWKDVAADVAHEIANFGGMVTKGVEKIVIGEKDNLSAKLTKVDRTMPEVITTKDEQIYANIIIKNNGSKAFPQRSFLQNMSGLYGEMIALPPLEPKKEIKVLIILKGSKKAGNFISKWRFGYSDDRNMTKLFGEEFEVQVKVVEKTYSKDVQEKARTLKELLPQTDIDTFLDFVDQDPKKTIDALIEDYLLNNPSN